MNALIPRPTGAAASAACAGSAPRGAWHVTSPRPELDAVVRVVRELLAPHARVAEAESADGAGATGAAGAEGVLTLEPAYGDDVPAARPVGVTVGAGDEAHAVRVGADGIVCRGRTPEGVFRAAMSAVQMIATGSVADQDFTDAPRYAWRGIMVDPARSFIGLDELRRLVDLAALYKLNVLHVHLTDNEGWRLEIPGMPELTADGRPHYTAEEYRALQEYAAARFVTVIPEIDLPGHCAALRAAYPGLPPAPTPPEAAAVLERLGAVANFTAPLDLDDATTADLVTRIFAQVCALTEGPFVHIGADEAAGMTHESYVSAVRHLRDAVRAHGKQPIGWQESSRAGIGAEDIGQFWVTPEMMFPADAETSPLGPELHAAVTAFFAPTADDLDRIVAGGGRVVLSPQSHVYLDRPHDPALTAAEQAETVARLGMPVYEARGVRAMADWDPADHGVPEAQVAGIEAALWGESITCFDDLTTLLLPRLPAVAETAWSGGPAEWSDYGARLARHAELWEQRGLAYLKTTEIDWEKR